MIVLPLVGRPDGGSREWLMWAYEREVTPTPAGNSPRFLKNASTFQKNRGIRVKNASILLKKWSRFMKNASILLKKWSRFQKNASIRVKK